MDLYLPDEFYALSESPNPHRDHAVAVRDDMLWLGAEASVAPLPETEENRRRKRLAAEPDPIWCVV